MEEDEAFEAARKARVKELEYMVRQLERENRALLNSVTKSAEKYREEASSGDIKSRGSASDAKLRHSSSVDDLISLDGDLARADEDEWLFVSPAKPPTPTQKQVTPSQWLTRGGVATTEDPVFSLDDVRKDLSFQIANVESMSPSNTRKAVRSPLAARRQLSNPTAQKYLDQVRERRASPPAEGLTPPTNQHSIQPQNNTSTDPVPVVKWKKPVLPQEEPPGHTTEEAVPVVRWKKPTAVSQHEATEEEEGVPVVRWKRPVIPDHEPSHAMHQETVPVVRWKRPVIPQASPSPSSGSEEAAVPAVKWKRPVMPVQDEPQAPSEDVPVVNWKPPRQRNVLVKGIITTAKSPPDEAEVEGYHSHTLPRPSARHRGLQSPGKGSPSSPQYRRRNLSAERPSQTGPSSLRSRSPSPSAQPGRAGSRSPSPIVHRSSPTTGSPLMRLSPKTTRTHHTTPSPTRSLQPPASSKQNLPKSPSAPGPRKAVPPGSPRGRNMVPTSVSAPTTQKRLVSPGRKLPSPPSNLGPPVKTQRQQPSTPPRTGGPRPRTQHSPQRAPRGTQLVTPHSAPQSKHSRQNKNQKQDRSHDNWLEGCF